MKPFSPCACRRPLLARLCSSYQVSGLQQIPGKPGGWLSVLRTFLIPVAQKHQTLPASQKTPQYTILIENVTSDIGENDEDDIYCNNPRLPHDGL